MNAKGIEECKIAERFEFLLSPADAEPLYSVIGRAKHRRSSDHMERFSVLGKAVTLWVLKRVF